MKSEFLTELKTELRGERIHILLSDLVYYSALLDAIITVPAGFETDLASVPRVPIIFTLWGDRAHREGVLHDGVYCVDFYPKISYSEANKVFLEAMKSRGVPAWIRYPMYSTVCMFGWKFFRKRKITDPVSFLS